MNSEPELVTKDGNEFSCAACGSRFDAAGKIAAPQSQKQKLPTGKPAKGVS